MTSPLGSDQLDIFVSFLLGDEEFNALIFHPLDPPVKATHVFAERLGSELGGLESAERDTPLVGDLRNIGIIVEMAFARGAGIDFVADPIDPGSDQRRESQIDADRTGSATLSRRSSGAVRRNLTGTDTSRSKKARTSR